MVNYAEEVSKLEAFKPEESSNYWSPVPGQYKVKALSELIETEPYQEEGKPDKARMKLEIEVGGVKKTWTMTVGKTLKSTYGQLCNLASKTGQNKLTDKEFTVVVVSDGNRNSYTIVI